MQSTAQDTTISSTAKLQALLKKPNFSHDEVMSFAISKADVNITDENGNSVIAKLALLNADKFNETIHQLITHHEAKTIISNTVSSLDSSQIKFSIKIAEGTYGTVFLGHWNNEQVAIKTFLFRDQDIAKQLKHYCLEVNTLSKLKNLPNIIGFKGYDSKHHHILLEYADKGSLEDAIRNPDDRFSWEKCYAMTKGIATGLVKMHES